MKKTFTKFLTLLGALLFLGTGTTRADGYSGFWLHLPGNHNNKNTYDGVEFSYDGLAVWKDYKFNGQAFTTHFYNSADKTSWYKSSNLTSYPTEQWIDMHQNSESYKSINGDNSNKSYNVFWDQVTERMWLSPVYPSKIYMIGNVNGNKFSPIQGVALSGTNGIYTGKVTLGDNGAEYAYFSFSEAIGKNTDDESNWNALGLRYGASYSDKPVNSGDNSFQEGSNSFKVASGTYNISVDLNNKKFSLTPAEDSWYLCGMFNTSSQTDWPSVEMTKVDGTNCLYSATIKPTFKTGKFLVRQNSNNHWKTKDGKKLTENQSKNGNGRRFINLNKLNGEGDDAEFELETGKNYVFLWDADNNLLTVRPEAYPETMYIYGHIDNSWWDKDNYIELTSKGNGVYENPFVEITGFWRQRDVNLKSDRTLYNPTEGENYIALFDFNPEGFPVDDKNLYWGMKYGSYHVVNNFENNYKPSKSSASTSSTDIYTASIVYQPQDDVNNFVIPDGCYKVTVDLNNGTVTFESGQTKERAYSWFYGSNPNPKDETAKATLISDTQDNYAVHEFLDGQNGKNILQVGIDKNLFHKAARQVRYQVWYREPSKANKPGLRKANELIGSDNVGKDFKDVTGQNDYYTTYGGEDYNTNHLIELNKVGEYAITAELKPATNENGTPIRGYIQSKSNNLIDDLANYDIAGSSIRVFVNAVTVIPNIGTTTTGQEDDEINIAQAFSTSGTNTFEGLLSFDTDVKYGTDFTLGITPVDNASSWATTTASAEEMAATYAAALVYEGATLPQQYENLKAPYVDGFYKAGSANVTPSENSTLTNGQYTFDLFVQVPCSGLYTLSVTPLTGSSYDVTSTSVVVKIYPNLVGKFGNDMGFNIEGNTFTDAMVGNESPDINLPTEFVNTWYNMAVCNAFIPGTYFASNFGLSSETRTVAEGDEMTSGTNYTNVNNSHYKTILNLSELKENPNATVNVPITITKNGATANYTFKVKASNTNTNPTGMDAIGAEESGEAVYYNLQGVRIENPEHGIFVKVQGGKASKVVL